MHAGQSLLQSVFDRLRLCAPRRQKLRHQTSGRARPQTGQRSKKLLELGDAGVRVRSGIGHLFFRIL